MRVFAISDFHLSNAVNKPMDLFGESWENHFESIKQDWTSKVSDDDIVLICGDFSWAMQSKDVVDDFAAFEGLKGKKVIIRGNHDYWWNTISQVRQLLPQNFYAIQNDCLRMGDVLLFGTRGWICPEDSKPLNEQDNKIYLREIERLKLSLSCMQQQRLPTDRVICMMHYPPFNSRYQDSAFIRLLIEHNVNTVVYGHLHGKDSRAELVVNKYGITFYLTSCDLLSNKLVEIT